MPLQILKPNAITSISGSDFTQDVATLRETDGFSIASSYNLMAGNLIIRMTFDQLANGEVLADGNQTITITTSQDADDMDMRFRLYENGTLIHSDVRYSIPLDTFEIFFNFDRSVMSSNTLGNLEFELEAVSKNIDNGGSLERMGWQIDQVQFEANTAKAITTYVNPDVPEVISPANGQTTNNKKPTFSAILTDSEGATIGDQVKLFVEYSSDNFVSNIFTLESEYVNSGETASVTAGSDLANNTYEWRAKAIDSGGLESDYTPTYSLTVENRIPNVPTNLFPDNNVVVTTTYFDASATITDPEGDPVTMEIQLSDVKDFSNVLQSYVVSTPTSVNTFNRTFSGLTQGNYYWRARAKEVGTVRTSAWTGVRGVFVNIPTSGRLSPDSILSQTNLTGSISAVTDDPDNASDSTWLTASSDSNTSVRVSFPTPQTLLKVGAGLQQFKVRVRTTTTATSPSAYVILYENGVERARSGLIDVTSGASQVLTFSFDANLLSNVNGSNVECELEGIYRRSGGNRAKVEVGGIEWNYTLVSETQDPAPETVEPVPPNEPVLAIEDGATLTEPIVTATIVDPQGKPVKLIVEYSLTPDFSTSYIAESELVESGQVVEVPLTNVVDGQTVYMRVKSSDGTLESQVVESSFVYSIPEAGTPIEANRTLKPTAITFIENLTPNDVTYLQDSPTNPDSNGLVLTPINNLTQPRVRLAFDPPVYDLTGIQTINLSFTDTNWVGCRIEVYENGVLKFTSGNSYNGYAGVIASYDWDASVLTTKTTENVEIEVVAVLYNGLTPQSINAVEWYARTLEVVDEEEPNPDPTVNANYVTPIELFPFDNSAWKTVEASAVPSSVDGSQVKLIVEYSKTQDFSGEVHRAESSLVNSGTKVTLPLTSFTFTDGEEVYWRAWSSNNLTTLASARTPIFNFTYKPSGFFSSATEFMQQGDPTNHIKIIDVSEYQGTIDWQMVKDSGINYVYLRAWGSSRTAFGDVNFENYIQQAKAVGIKTGAYIYAMGGNPTDTLQARQEADRFIAKLEAGYGTGQYGDLVPMLDFEDNTAQALDGQAWTDYTVEQAIQWCNEFRNYFEAQTGRTLGLYTSDNFVRDTMNNFNHDDSTGQAVAGTSGNLLVDMPLWIAGFTKYDRYKGNVMPVCGGWTKWQMFQYSENGTTSGIVGNVDQNFGEPIEWVMPPNNITGLSPSDNGTSVTITWNHSTEEDVVGYNIYKDGVVHDWIDRFTNVNSYTYTGLTPNVPYEIGVSATDTYGDNSLNRTLTNYTIVTTPSTPPKVTVLSVSKTKISDEPEFDRAEITFIFDMDVKEFTVNVNGVDYATGLIAHSGGGKSVLQLSSMTVGELSLQTVQQISIIVAGMEIVAEVDYTELSQGDNRVNIYGKSIDGTWTPYSQ
jgi:GH25 family lysozyme M1 (1,4-beta-N-acetylmuramidase)